VTVALIERESALLLVDVAEVNYREAVNHLVRAAVAHQRVFLLPV
jgi:hypothetical protein